MTVPTNTGPAISVTGVDKVFTPGHRNEVTALTGIDLDVAPGELVSLIGPSGCGKSTLLRLVGDLETPTAGSVEVNGKAARQARLDHDYGMAFQQAGLFDWRTVAANVELPLELLHVPQLLLGECRHQAPHGASFPRHRSSPYAGVGGCATP